MFNLPFAHINSFLVLDGEKYQVEKFNIKFSQAGDYKGQPQHEVQGGLINIVLDQAANDSLFLWAKKSTMVKDGHILFQSDLGMTVMVLAFFDAYCISLTREINAMTGTRTSLIISPKKVVIDGIEHENYWGLNN
ncbi:MAG: hypothetical protein RL662_2222 [Bacteroidota bacterium]|jgi:hypothetical protein